MNKLTCPSELFLISYYIHYIFSFSRHYMLKVILSPLVSKTSSYVIFLRCNLFQTLGSSKKPYTTGPPLTSFHWNLFIITSMRCRRNLALAYINSPMIILVLSHIVSLKAAKSIDAKEGLTIFLRLLSPYWLSYLQSDCCVTHKIYYVYVLNPYNHPDPEMVVFPF